MCPVSSLTNHTLSPAKARRDWAGEAEVMCLKRGKEASVDVFPPRPVLRAGGSEQGNLGPGKTLKTGIWVE